MTLLPKINKLKQKFEKREPTLLAFVPEEGRIERLSKEAKVLQKQYHDEENRPPLFGMLVGVKDIFHVDRFLTHAGSQLPPEVLTGPESEAVSRLKAAGALIVGKTVTTEFAYFAPGPTHNPRRANHTPGGSSSGSAAAVAAGLCEIALGTQTIGSINRPAAFCGVVGFKPSYDRISREGVIPLSPSVDHVGILSASVDLAALTASILISDWKPLPNTKSQNPTLGIPTGPYLKKAEKAGQDHFWQMVTLLEEADIPTVHVPAMPDFDEIAIRHNAIVAYDAARVHEKWFAEYGHLYHPKTVELIQRGQKISEDDYQNALKGREQLRQELCELMEEHGVDLWLSPSAPGLAPKGLDSTGDPIMNLPWTHAGLPTMTLPAGKNKRGLPLGLQFAGGWYADEQLLNWAKALELQISNIST